MFGSGYGSGMRLAIAVIALAGWLSAAGVAQAQQSSLFGAGGALSGSSGFGSGSSGAGAGASGGAFNTAPGSMAPGGFGAAFGATQNAAGSAQGQGASLTGGPQTGGFVGRNDTTGRQVGNAQAGAQAGAQGNRNNNNQMNRNQTGVAGAATRNRTSRNANNNQQGAFNQQGGAAGNASQQRQIRPQLRVAIEYQPPTAERLEKTLNTRFEKLAVRLAEKGAFQGVTISANRGTVTLRGMAGTEEDRRLAGMLAGMEPGVRSVNNELVVARPVSPEDVGE